MATQLSTFLSEIYQSLGNNSSAEAAVAATRGVNFGQLIAALTYLPPELEKSQTLTVQISGVSASLSGLTLLHTLGFIQNSTSGDPVYLMPKDKFFILVPTGSGDVKYAFRNDQTLYVLPTPIRINNLLTFYRVYPTVLIAPADLLTVLNYDPFILSIATSYAQAYLEEGESSDLWAKIGGACGVALNQGSVIRYALEEALGRGYKL